MRRDVPRLWLLAGPNGAGKSTFAQGYFQPYAARGLFLNADDEARSIDSSNPSDSALAAGRAVIAKRRTSLSERRSFVLETTLASRSLLQFVEHARLAGYRTTLLYLYVTDSALCIERVAMRVARGGHHIPPDVVLRRYRLSLELLPSYLSTVDEAEIFLADNLPRIIARKAGGVTDVTDPVSWSALRAAQRQ